MLALMAIRDYSTNLFEARKVNNRLGTVASEIDERIVIVDLDK